MDFSYKNYKNILETLKQNNYSFKFLNEEVNEEKVVYLRHDVDMDLYGSVKLAEIEKEIGAKSIFYVLPSCRVYNILDLKSLEIINKIISLGHQVGLHIDASVYKTKEEMEEDLNRLYDFFSKYFDITKSISFHIPNPNMLDEDLNFEGYINAYEKRFYKDIIYVSDSNRREFLNEERFPKAIKENLSLQLLTHPIWWKEKSLEKLEIVEFFNKEFVNNFSNSMFEDCLVIKR